LLPWLLRIGAVLAVLGGLWGLHHHIDRGGYDRAMAENEAKERQIAAQVADATKQAADLAMSRERAHIREIDATATQRTANEASHEKTITALQRDALDGRVGLSVQLTNTRAACRGAPPENPAATGGSSEPARAELMPGSASRILGFAGDAAKLVRDYNAVLVEYERARNLCNLDDEIAQ
jgi:hypothetical protein